MIVIISDMEMRWVVVGKVHGNHNSIKAAYFRHISKIDDAKVRIFFHIKDKNLNGPLQPLYTVNRSTPEIGVMPISGVIETRESS